MKPTNLAEAEQLCAETKELHNALCMHGIANLAKPSEFHNRLLKITDHVMRRWGRRKAIQQKFKN